MKRRSLRIITVVCLVLAFLLQTVPASEAKFDKTKAKKNIKRTYKVLDDGVLVKFKNKNNTTVSLKATMKFFDARGTLIGEKETIKNYAFGKKKTMAYFFRTPVTEKNVPKNYSSYKVKISVSKSKSKDYSGKIKINLKDLGVTGVDGTAMNLSSANLTSVNASFLFTTASGKLLFVKNMYFTCTRGNSAVDFSISYPDKQPPSKVQIIVNWAC